MSKEPAGARGNDRVAAIREFNRFYTTVVGAVGEGLLQSPYSLTEARVIFEIAQQDTTRVGDLRRSLDIDAGYLSRLLARLEGDGLAAATLSQEDKRQRVVRLTGEGRRVFEMLDSRAAEEVASVLERLGEEDQRRLVGAMRTIQAVLGATERPGAFVLRPLRAGDFGWVVHRHGVLYAEGYGWNETFEALVARIVADYVDDRDPDRENAWIAEVDGEPVGCVFCTRREANIAQVRLLLVEPRVRGMGIGARLVEECIRFARRTGYERMTLWTNDVLDSARRIYEGAGFQLVEENRHHSFGHDLVGQTWSLELGEVRG